MRRSNRLIILLGIFLAVTGGVLTAVFVTTGSGGNGGGPNAAPSATAEPTTRVVVAKQNINLGDKITADMIGTETITVSQAAALGSDTYSSTSQVIGKVAGGDITTGQVLLGSRDFLQAGAMVEGQDIAGSIATGMLGVSLVVDQINGVGTLLVPGDRVDVILSVYVQAVSLTAKEASGGTIAVDGGSQVTTKMVIQNRKILATLLQPSTALNSTPAPGSSYAAPTATAGIVQNTERQMVVILEVKPDEAEILRWAQRAEKQDPQNYIDLSLALRSDKDNDLPNVTTPGITFKMLVDKYGVLPPDPRAMLPTDLTKGISW